MKKSLLALAALVAVLGVDAAQAGANVGQWIAGAGGSWTKTDKDRGLDDTATVYVAGGFAMSENWDVGVNVFTGKFDITGSTGKRRLSGITFDFDRVFNRDQRVSPYLLVGAGIVDQFRPGLSIADKEVVAKFGGGTTADLLEFGGGNKLQLKVEAAVRTSIGRQITDIGASLGLQVAFGGK